MKKNYVVAWFTIAGIIGILFGVFYAIFGLEGLPVYQRFVPVANFEAWSRGLYGSTFIGFSVLLLLVGRRAAQQDDEYLAKVLLGGILAWLVVEAFVSIVYGVYINVAVDVALAIFLGYPLLKVIRR
jgi:hypothetical protein